ncbi:MAG: dihydropteroate synthase [Propionibacteriaceae bacterium]|nr:dihydropteroate synthase [Propionibacteriaceae bacterium]
MTNEVRNRTTSTTTLIDSSITLGLDHARKGAAIVDVGGESTRPGAHRVSEAEELARVIPVVEALASEGVAVSIDTVRATVAKRAIEVGAVIINDVSGGLVEPEIMGVAASHKVGFILGHWRTPFDHESTHESVVNEVLSELTDRIKSALNAGLDPGHLVVDPGIGFGKSAEQNWELIAHVDEIQSLGFPTLWGVSRKRFLATMYNHDTHPWERDDASVDVGQALIHAGVWGLRVHHLDRYHVDETEREDM